MKIATWRKACQIARDELVVDVCGRAIERWCFLHEDNHNELPVSDRGNIQLLSN